MWTFSGPDLPFFDPEWTDGGSTYSQNNVSSNFFYTLAHRAVAFGDPISNGDKISFNESHYYSCPTNLTNPIEPVESIKSASTNMNPNVSKALISNLEIFPNPTNGEAKLTYQSSSPSRISLFDVNGQEIMQKQVDSKGKIEEMINCGELNNGIYILKISNQDKVLAKKLIVRR